MCKPTPAELDEKEFARREVLMWHDGGVMATITATVPAPDAIAIWNALTGCAHAMKDRDRNGETSNTSGKSKDTRTMAHKRADALVDWARQALNDPRMPTMQGKKRLDTQVVIDLSTLLGLTDHPGEIIGFGPIPAALARRLATQSDSWRRLVTDPITGHLLDYGVKTYSPPAALREYIIARDRTCQFPGCNRAGYLCDLDHIDPFTGAEEGGRTSADNLITMCRRHHRLKTHNHWKVRIVKPRDGEQGKTFVEWTSPRQSTHTRVRPSPLEGELPEPVVAESDLSRRDLPESDLPEPDLPEGNLSKTDVADIESAESVVARCSLTDGEPDQLIPSLVELTTTTVGLTEFDLTEFEFNEPEFNGLRFDELEFSELEFGLAGLLAAG